MPQDSAFLSAEPQLWVQTSHKTLGGLDGHHAMFGLKGSLDVHLLHHRVFYGLSWCRLVLLAMHNVAILQCINTTITNNIKYWDTGRQVLHSAEKPCFLNAFHPPVSSSSSFPARFRQSVHVIWGDYRQILNFVFIVNFVTSLQKQKLFLFSEWIVWCLCFLMSHHSWWHQVDFPCATPATVCDGASHPTILWSHLPAASVITAC